MGARTLKDLRAEAFRARRAVIAEEDRQRDAYNDALEHLRELVTARLTGGRWVVGERQRKHQRIVTARPGWASKDMIAVAFAHAEADTPDLYEDLTAKAVEVLDTATGHAVWYNHAPHPDLLMAVVETVMELASPPDQ